MPLQPRNFIRGFRQRLLVCENFSKLSSFHSDTSGVGAASKRQMFLSDVTAIAISFSQSAVHRCVCL
jgi:hypothetical protein